MQLFNPVTMSKTELDIVRKAMADPAVIKFLTGIAQDAAVSLATSNRMESAEDIKSNFQYIQGSIHVVEQLLSLVEESQPVA